MNFYKPIGHAVLWATLGLSTAMPSDLLKSEIGPPENILKPVVINPEETMQEKGEELSKTDSHQDQKASIIEMKESAPLSIPKSLEVSQKQALKGNLRTPTTIPTPSAYSSVLYPLTYAGNPGTPVPIGGSLNFYPANAVSAVQLRQTIVDFAISNGVAYNIHLGSWRSLRSL